MDNFKEYMFGLAQVLMGMIIMIALIAILDIVIYLGATGSAFSGKVALAFSEGYDIAYDHTYEDSYRTAYVEAYDKGYQKGYELGLDCIPAERVGRLVELRNPTYAELKEFLAADETNTREYISGEYVCYDFVAEMNNNAEAVGIRAAYVRVRSENWAHALVAFETVDKGLLFIEPQSDRSVKLKIGEPYPWWQAGAASPLFRQDRLTEIEIIW
jgi:hypothetical protein